MAVTQMNAMLLLVTLFGIVAGIPLRDYNVTFPCGPQENNQRCRFPDEFCHIYQESCLPCNDDICREQDSDPSCRAYCYDRTASVTKNWPTARDSSGEKSFSECSSFSIPMVILVVLTFVLLLLSALLCLKIRKIENLQTVRTESIPMELPQRTDNDNFIVSPTDQNCIVTKRPF